MDDELRFERFDKSRHRRSEFDCGVRELNDFLKVALNQQMKRGVTVGYVLANSAGRIAGYMTLSAGALAATIVPTGRGFPTRLPLPATLLGRLAVDNAFRSGGLGGMLLMHALRLAVEAADSVASAVVEVDAKDDAARSFYARFGFASLSDDRLHMYLPMSVARVAVRR